ncbi:MAG: hypothetical protein EBV03_04090 [Proteobacteria bacterium]|nr:hypothetical protein [Pseudomonadota bacterium]
MQCSWIDAGDGAEDVAVQGVTVGVVSSLLEGVGIEFAAIYDFWGEGAFEEDDFLFSGDVGGR